MPEWTPWITFGIAVAGFVLSVFNACLAFTRGSVRLRVRPIICAQRRRFGRDIVRMSTSVDSIDDLLDGNIGIEVVNAGNVPVTIDQLGLMPMFGRLFGGYVRRVSFVEDPDGNTLPKELPPRTALRFFAAHGALDMPTVRKCRYVYAKTQCDRTIYGSAQLIRKFTAKRDATLG